MLGAFTYALKILSEVYRTTMRELIEKAKAAL